MKMRPRIKRSKVGAKPKCHKENSSNLNEITEDTLDLEIPDFSEKSENNEILTLEGIEKLLDKKFEVFEKRFEEKNGELAKSVINVKSSLKKIKKSLQIIHSEQKEFINQDQNEQKEITNKETNKNQNDKEGSIEEINKIQKEIIEKINKNQAEIIAEINKNLKQQKSMNKNQKEQNEIIEIINKYHKEFIEEINKNKTDIIEEIDKKQTEQKEIIEKKSKNILDNCKINQHQIEIVEVNSNNILDKCIGKFNISRNFVHITKNLVKSELA